MLKQQLLAAATNRGRIELNLKQLLHKQLYERQNCLWSSTDQPTNLLEAPSLVESNVGRKSGAAKAKSRLPVCQLGQSSLQVERPT